MEADRADELGVEPVTDQTPEVTKAEQDKRAERERRAEAKIRKLAIDREPEPNEETTWAVKNIHRPWSELSLDVPSENAITLWQFACGNEVDFRRMYHSKPKVVKDEGDKPEEVISESEQPVMETIERLLAG